MVQLASDGCLNWLQYPEIGRTECIANQIWGFFSEYVYLNWVINKWPIETFKLNLIFTLKVYNSLEIKSCCFPSLCDLNCLKRWLNILVVYVFISSLILHGIPSLILHYKNRHTGHSNKNIYIFFVSMCTIP